MPTWGFNRPDLLLLGTGCILGPAIPYRREGGGAGLGGGGEREVLKLSLSQREKSRQISGILRWKVTVANGQLPGSLTRQRQGLPGMLVGGGDKDVKQRGLQGGRHRTESQRVLASTQLLLAMGKPAHSRHLNSLVCTGRSLH